MKTRTLIIAALLTCSATLFGAVSPVPWSYRIKINVKTKQVVISDPKGAELATAGPKALAALGCGNSENPTRDQLRHAALNIVAAAIAGSGGREHTVDPNSHVYAVHDREKPYVTLTMEQGVTFVMVDDTYHNSIYEARIHNLGRIKQ
jgi:hypothetical protein